jgi:hypothetical protein
LLPPSHAPVTPPGEHGVALGGVARVTRQRGRETEAGDDHVVQIGAGALVSPLALHEREM